ncbi:MAG: T9SS type A sorting domain-containing protein [Gracilimonas sp.]
MKKLMLLLIVCALAATTAVQAQTLDDYVDSYRGDTMVVKSYVDMGQEANSLVNAISADTVDVPVGRVYELKRDGWYPSLENIASPADRELVIVGQGNGSMTQGTIEDGFPAVFSGIQVDDQAFNNGFLTFNNTATVKNVAIVNGDNNGTPGWGFFSAGDENQTLNLENVIMEHTRWIFLESNNYAGTSLNVSDSYFVNMTGEPCRRNGGVYDNVNYNTNSIRVENSTHIMGSGIIYKFRSYPVNEVFINHNTFVNISGQVFASWGNQSNYIVSNNLFVNANVQGYIPGLDYGELDRDYLPHGIINIDSLRTDRGGEGTLTIDAAWIEENYPDIAVEDFGPDDRKVLVTNNGVFWHDDISTIHETLNSNSVPCPIDESGSDCVAEQGTWVPQSITMNSRTQAMFDDDETYPYLTEGPWVDAGDPQFTEDNGLVDGEALQALIDWSVSAAGEPGSLMAFWRDPENPASENYIYSDYPVYANLSYSNSAYLEGGTGGFPLGDLNWFPAEKEAWMAQRDAEHSMLVASLNDGTLPVSNERTANVPASIKLDQNYPNPFNPTTNISFNLPQAQSVTIKVYDMLGREVAILVNNEQFSSGAHEVKFNAKNLSSGVYFYTLKAGNIVQSKTMTLIK